MSIKRKTLAEEKKKTPYAETERGVQDDYEVLRIVVASNPTIKLRVLNKIRELRSSFQTNIFDETKDKEEKAREIKQRRSL